MFDENGYISIEDLVSIGKEDRLRSDILSTQSTPTVEADFNNDEETNLTYDKNNNNKIETKKEVNWCRYLFITILITLVIACIIFTFIFFYNLLLERHENNENYSQSSESIETIRGGPRYVRSIDIDNVDNDYDDYDNDDYLIDETIY